jgi:MFS family permease
LNVLKTYRNSFSPLRLPNFRLYLGGQALSLIGTWVQSSTLAWVVWQLTGQEAQLGAVTALSTLPILLLGLWTGVWADRADRRKLLIGTQTAAMLLAFILAFLLQTDSIQLWHIYVLSFCLGIVTALDFPAQQAFLGDLAGMGEVRKAVNLNAMIINISRSLGPALAGVIIGRAGAAAAFWLNGLSFFAVIVSLVLVKSHQEKSKPSGKAMWHEFVEGLKFIKGQPRIQDLLTFVAMVTFLGFSVLTLSPAFADTILHGNAETYGYLLSASGAGALIGVLLVVPMAQAAKYTGRILIGAALWMGMWLMIMSQVHELFLAQICILLVSIGAPTVITMAFGLLQLLAPPDMRGRLVTVNIMLSFGMQPIASIVIGLSAQTFTIPIAILINGVLMFGGGAIMLIFRPELRHWIANQHQPTAPQPELSAREEPVAEAMEAMEL